MNIGMYNVANTCQQDSSLEMTLKGLKLEKYYSTFIKKGLKFDTFVNATKDDLIQAGVKDEEDIKSILNGVFPLKHLYKDIADLPPPDYELILGNNLHHLRSLLGLTILLRKSVTKKGKRPKNKLIDTKHSSANAVIKLVEALIEQLDYLEQDLLKTEIVEKKFSRKKMYLMTGGIVTSGVLATTYFIYRYCGGQLDIFQRISRFS